MIISVGGKKVFPDPTPESLGYVMLPLRAVKGNSLRVPMSFPYQEGDAFSNVIEITGKKENATGTVSDKV